MSAGPSLNLLRDVQTLFDSGTATGLSDRQLLERFAARRDPSAEAAFEILLVRHGPMVLRICRNSLADPNDAYDAFQATFLVLVKQCSSIRRLESVGSWLFGVATRVAARARVEAARRRTAERRAALKIVETADSRDSGEPQQPEFGPILQAEVKRLPEKYRSVVVLCYWEGLTQEQAAAQLGCPLGTVRSRLARARDILRKRLLRCGLAPLAGVVAASLGDSSASAAVAGLRLSPVPSELAHFTVKAAANVAVGEAVACVAPGLVTSLVHHVLWSLTMLRIFRLLVACTFIGLGVVGATLWAQQPREKRARRQPVVQKRRGPEEKPKAPAVRKFLPAHVVEPPDLLIVEVLEALPGRPISGERLVRPDGSISLGFYGDVQVGGLTLPEVKEKIIRRLQKFLNDDTLGLVEFDCETDEPKIDPATGKPVAIDPKDSDVVFVDVTAYNSANYYVEGEVREPGRFPCTGNDTVLDLIHYAGGLLDSADRSKVKLVRSYPKGSPVQVLHIDYDEVTMGTDASTNYAILPNDRLVIPRKPNYKPSPSSDTSTRPARRRSEVLVDPISPYSALARSAQRQVRQMVADEGHPPTSAPDHADQRGSSLQAIERRLSELEKKLDAMATIMRRIEQASRETEGKTSEGAARDE